jgi:hypothetical protein
VNAFTLLFGLNGALKQERYVPENSQLSGASQIVRNNIQLCPDLRQFNADLFPGNGSSSETALVGNEGI